MMPIRPMPARVSPAQLVILLVLSLLLISAAPYLPEPVLIPPPVAPEPPAGGPVEPSLSAAHPYTAMLACSHCAYLPVVSNQFVSIKANTFDRAPILSLYTTVYKAATPAIGWTGLFTSCSAGTTSAAFQAAVLQRINYYREMAGVPKVGGLNAVYNAQDQEAAYMMSVNNRLNHTPPSTWKCYTANGYDGASTSNLALGTNGPGAIHLYMDDGGTPSMGHRRWVLFPKTQAMGTGDIPGSSAGPSTNAMKAWDDHIWEARPATRYAFVAWPPPGYVPYTIISKDWSFSYPNADFKNSSISVTVGGTPLAVTPYALENGFGDNTLAWKINDVSGDWPKPAGDTTYIVTITDVAGITFVYPVIVFDPGS